MLASLRIATILKARLSIYFLVRDAMNKVYCSICGKPFTDDTQWPYDLDGSIECTQCIKKMNWFSFGLVFGIAAASLVFYLFYKGMQ